MPHARMSSQIAHGASVSTDSGHRLGLIANPIPNQPLHYDGGKASRARAAAAPRGFRGARLCPGTPAGPAALVQPTIVRPPDTLSTCPVTYAASSEAR